MLERKESANPEIQRTASPSPTPLAGGIGTNPTADQTGPTEEEFLRRVFREAAEPIFRGSPQQIDWARKIFDDRHVALSFLVSNRGIKSGTAKGRRSYLEALLRLRQETDPTFWIDAHLRRISNVRLIASARKKGWPAWRRPTT